MDTLRRFPYGLILGIIIGLLLAQIWYTSVAYAARQYIKSREMLADFSGDSIPILNQILRDLWWAIDDIDDRLTAHSI